MTEVTLLGQNVNSYGRDLTRRRPLFAELLRAVGAVEGIRRVRFTSPHPKDLRPETIAAMAETDGVCNHLHLPLQSGSDAVLAAMRRGYTAERYLARLAAARAAIPDLAVTTDLIVGFPGETEERLRAHARGGGRGGLRQRLHLHLLAPSGNPGGGDGRATSSRPRWWPSGSSGSGWWSSARHWPATAHRIGRVEEVVVEGPSKRDPSVITGRTAQNKLVHFQPGTGRSLPCGAPSPRSG